MKDTPVYGLERVPYDVVIKRLKIELGKANSLIDELQHSLKEHKLEINRITNLYEKHKTVYNDMKRDNKRLRNGIKRDEMYKELKGKLQIKSKEYKDIRDRYYSLIAKYNNS